MRMRFAGKKASLACLSMPFGEGYRGWMSLFRARSDSLDALSTPGTSRIPAIDDCSSFWTGLLHYEADRQRSK
jgi:hypothetical protein